MQETVDPRNLGFRTISLTINVVVIDLATKFFIFDNQDLLAKPPWFGFFRFTNHHNTGITFDLPMPLPFVLALTALIVFSIVRVLIQKRATITLLEALAYGLILGGALGNVADRIWLGYVRDWMLLFDRSAMNIADFSIIIGLILLLFVPRDGSSTSNPGQTG